MVGLDRPGGDEGIGALGDGIGGQVFELAQFVAAHGQGRQVVTLDIDVPAEPGGEAVEFFQRCRMAEQVETVKARQLLFDHGSVLVVGDAWTIGTPIFMGNRQSFVGA
ncbi:hypothetical protein D3C84_1014330 [compost metagenome]